MTGSPEVTVARMKAAGRNPGSFPPDCAALHPGYNTGL
jgi:hypothetical protein